MELYDEEEVYDEKISPLMQQIIEICKKHKIPMMASFTYINTKEDGPGRCTTHLPFKKREDKRNQEASNVIMRGGHTTLSMMVQEANHE